jgi:hypothetical protein
MNYLIINSTFNSFTHYLQNNNGFCDVLFRYVRVISSPFQQPAKIYLGIKNDLK